MNILMPWSPLDALLDALPEVRKAGKVRPGDTVLTVQKRLADIYTPIVTRIQKEAEVYSQAENERLRKVIRDLLDASPEACRCQACLNAHAALRSEQRKEENEQS